MKIITKIMPDNFNLWLWGDYHKGNILCSKNKFKKFCSYINSEYEGCKNNFSVNHGDNIEAILINDKRFFLKTSDIPFPLQQVAEVVKDFDPIKKTMITLLQGNHCRKLHYFGDLAAEIANRLNVPYGTYSCKIHYLDKNGRLIFKHYATHGYKSVKSTADDPKRRRSNMELILKRHLKNKAGDCLLMSKGHTHQLLVSKPEYEMYMTDDGRHMKHKYYKNAKSTTYIHPDHRWYANTGSFLKMFAMGESGYAEVAELDPVVLGVCVVMIRDQELVDMREVLL